MQKIVDDMKLDALLARDILLRVGAEQTPTKNTSKEYDFLYRNLSDHENVVSLSKLMISRMFFLLQESGCVIGYAAGADFLELSFLDDPDLRFEYSMGDLDAYILYPSQYDPVSLSAILENDDRLSTLSEKSQNALARFMSVSRNHWKAISWDERETKEWWWSAFSQGKASYSYFEKNHPAMLACLRKIELERVTETETFRPSLKKLM